MGEIDAAADVLGDPKRQANDQSVIDAIVTNGKTGRDRRVDRTSLGA